MKTILRNTILNNKAVDITIDNGLITNVEDAKVHALPPEEGTIDCSGLAVFPGLCNMHSHAPMTLFRGLGDDQPLDIWLNKYIWPAEQKLTDELVYEGTLRACQEMLASGTTGFNDMYFRLPSMAQAVKDSGMRAMLGLNIFGDGDEVGAVNELLHKYASQTIGFTIAPHSIYTVSEKGLRRCADACIDMHVPMHIHMSETQKEVDDCLREHGCRPWEYLHHITCVHCPNSNLKLGSGYRFPMLELLDAGARVTLGTDGSASSNNLDMIEVMKTAALLQKGWRGDPTVAPAEQILNLATIGHTIAPGQPACLFLVKLNTVTTSIESTSQAASNLIYATHGENVVLTLVDGKVVYKKS